MSSLVGQPREALDTPALMVDLDILQRNVDRMTGTIIRDAKVGWRPHTKAMKTPALANLCLDAGAHGITCAKLGEAEVMAAAGIRDILVANQIVGPAKIDRLVDVCRQADVMVCVDQFENVQAIDRAAGAKGVCPRVLIEVDVGMERAGVLPGEPTVSLARRIARLQHVRFAGLQTWEAHALFEPDMGRKKRMIEEALGEAGGHGPGHPGFGDSGGDRQLRRHRHLLDQRLRSRRHGDRGGGRNLLRHLLPPPVRRGNTSSH